VSGVLFDLGVSSPQLDRPERGFSYRADAPLDMRMDPSEGPTASDLVNAMSEADMARLFAAHGEGRFARRIARAVVAARPVTSTQALADVVRSALPAAVRRQGGHPARRVFQALRVAVNDELEVLADALPAAIGALSTAGRCVVISYHSGEDRIVKATFRDAETGGCSCPPGLPCVCGAVSLGKPVFRGTRRPSSDEIARNRRSESALLRAFERGEA
jgi:16S rRNA (cytosine1402-N4)-methyltransferase